MASTPSPDDAAQHDAAAPAPELSDDAGPSNDPERFDQIVNLSKRRGFVYPSAEIYGGFRSTWDYGPMGVLLLRNVKEAWWKSMVQQRDDVVGLDASILTPPAVWEASGHLTSFTDPLVDCKECGQRWRLDKLDDPDQCPGCKAKNSFTEPRNFNLMFSTHAGPVADDGALAYLRPETAQGMFTNFKNIINTTRVRPPFGVAQVGKSFRNEITPGNFVFRTREFEQMEMEYFVPPEDADKYYDYWKTERERWYLELGMPREALRLREHDEDELSHYSTATADVEYLFPWGWDELEGIANRGDYDLKAHTEHSGERLDWFDQAENVRYVPHVIEPAAGATRTAFAFLLAAYHVEEVRGEERVVLRLHPRLAPYKVAVLPLSKKSPLQETARALAAELRDEWSCEYDETQAIGRRYRRQDELGTPYCVTVDFDTAEDQAVTIRDRDTMEQVRIPLEGVADWLRPRLK